MRSALSTSFAFALLVSCGVRREVVQEGHFQERTHQRGWHIDLHGTRNRAPMTARTPSEYMRPRRIEPRCEIGNAHDRSLATTHVILLSRPMSAKRNWIPSVAQATATTGDRPQATLPQDGDESVTAKKKWNKLAVPAFALSLGTVALAFLTTSTTAVILAAVATLVVAGISLKQIRRREEGGKGFALIGLIIGLLATLITAAAIGAYGFD